MEQLDLFETGELQPIRQWLHVWSDAERTNKKASAQGRGEDRQMPVGGCFESEGHQAASCSSGHCSAQSRG